MSEENFDMLKGMLDSFLTMSKRGLVAKKPNRSPGAEAGSESSST
jgi:hypothetical protein